MSGCRTGVYPGMYRVYIPGGVYTHQDSLPTYTRRCTPTRVASLHTSEWCIALCVPQGGYSPMCTSGCVASLGTSQGVYYALCVPQGVYYALCVPQGVYIPPLVPQGVHTTVGTSWCTRPPCTSQGVLGLPVPLRVVSLLLVYLRVVSLLLVYSGCAIPKGVPQGVLYPRVYLRERDTDAQSGLCSLGRGTVLMRRVVPVLWENGP